MSVLGSLLWPRPIACPSSWMTTLRATLGKLVGSRFIDRIPMIRLGPEPKNGLANEMKSELPSTIVNSPGRASSSGGMTIDPARPAKTDWLSACNACSGNT